MKNVQISAEKGATIQYADMTTEGLMVKAEQGKAIAVGSGVKGSLK